MIFAAFDAHGPVIIKHIRDFTPDLYEKLESYVRWSMDYDNVFSTIPEEKLIQEICIKAIEISILFLDDIPEKYCTYELYLEYVKHLGTLEDVPDKFIDATMCETAVAADFKELQWVPAEYQTEAMYEDAFRQNESFAYKRRGSGLNLLQYMHNQTEKICLRGVKQNGLALKNSKYQTDEICLAAVHENGLALEFVENQTTKICFEAVDENRKALMHIRDKDLAQLTALYASGSPKDEE